MRKLAWSGLLPKLCLIGIMLLGLGDMASAQIVQRGSATNNTSSSTNISSLSIDKPSGVVAGDVLIASILQNETDNDNGGLSNASASGWTVIDGRIIRSAGAGNGSNAWHGTVLYRVATGTEGGSFSFSLPNSRADMAIGAIVAFSGVDVTGGVQANGNAGGPFDLDPGTLNLTNANMARASSVTTATPNAAVLMLSFINDNVSFSNWTATNPATLTELYDRNTSSADDGAVGAAWAIRSTAGATGDGNVTIGGTDYTGSIFLVLKQAPTCPSFALTSTTAAAACTSSGTAVTLAGNAANLPTGNYTVTYNLSGANTATGQTANMTVATAGSGSFTTANLANTGNTTVTITNLEKDDCSSAISANRSSTFTVSAPTEASIAYAGSPYCSTGGTASVTLTGTTGGSFSSTAGLSLNSSTGAVNLSASTAGTYTVSYTYGSCSASTTASITVSAPPTASNAGPDQAICASDGQATMAATAPTVGTGQWSQVSGAAATITNPASRNTTITGLAAGSYTFRWTVSNAPCTATSDEVVITVAPAPSTADAGPDQAVCEGSALALGANTPAVGTGAWSIVSGPNTSTSQLSSITAADASFTPSAEGSYTLRWTTSSEGCANSTDDVVITASPAPPAFTVTPSSASLCGGQSVTLSAMLPAAPGGTIGRGTATNANTAYPSPYGAYYETQRVQYLLSASELGDLGFAANSTISSIGFTVSDVASSGLHTGYTIKLANTAAANLGSAWQTVDATANFGPVDYVPTAGLNTHVFNTPFVWDGSSNVVVDICHNNDPNNAGNLYTANARVAFTTTAFTSVRYRRADNVDLCGTTGTPTATSADRANMTLTGDNGYSITWSPALGLDVSSGESVVATPPGSMVYTATLSQAGANCSRSVEVPITLSGSAPDAPVVVASGPTEFNLGDAVSFSAEAGGAPITWYDAPAGGQVVATGATYAVATACSPGSFAVYAGTEANGCASARTLAAYTVRPLISSDPANGLICSQGGSVNLTLNALNASGITWSPGTGLTSTNTAITTASPTVTTSYSVSATVPGCGSLNGSINVGVIDGATFTPTASAEEVCAVAEVTLASNLSASGFSAGTIAHAPSVAVNATALASGGTVEVATTSCTFCPLDDAGWAGIPLGFDFDFFGNTYSTVNVGTNGLIQFGEYNAAGLSDYLFTNALPNAAEPLNIVAGVAVDLIANSAGTIRYWTEGLPPTRTFVMEWLNVPGYSNSGTNGITTSQIKLFETTGIVEVHVSTSTSTATKVVGLQNADASIGSTAFSGTGSITNQAWRFVPGADYTFQWSQSGQNLAGATEGTYTFNAPAVPGAYTYAVAATNPATGCVSTKPVGFTVNEVPAAPVVTPEVVYCQGAAAVALSASGAQGNTLQWYTQPTGGSASATAPTPSTASVGSVAYYVSQITAIGCESPRDTTTVVVNPSPTAPAATSAITYCQNAIAVPLEATATAGNSLKWYTVASGGTGSTNAPTPSTASAGTTSWYVAQVSGANSCESPRTTVSVTINATPDAPTVTSPVTYCQDAAATALSATVSAGNTLAWYEQPSGGAALAGSPVPSTAVPGSTFYYVQQSTTQGCASVRALIEVVVDPTITPAVSNSASSTSACGGAITFTAIPSNGGDSPSYQWFLNNAAIPGATQQTYVLGNPLA
ncbi:MAG: hypothetical protein WEC15_02670, partial [Flavobacteriales bacterium]